MTGAGASLERSAEGLWVVELRERQLGQHVRILPEVGATLVDYRIQHAGRTVPLIDPPPDLQAVRAEPMRWGCPLLFPFPNRVRDGRFVFDGKEHRFTESFLNGHHIHGLVYARPWRIERCVTATNGALVELVFRSRSFPEIKPQYPFPFELRAVYALVPAGLLVTFRIRNVGRRPLPMGLGLHPYLRAPIDASSPRRECRVRIPASERWELADRLPTGRRVGVSGSLDLRAGRPLDGLVLDDPLTGLDPHADTLRCELEDRTAGLRTVLEMERAFREVVVYTPPDRQSVCIEPYTCVTDAPNLQARGVDAGLRVLGAGEEFRARARLFSEPI